MNAKLGCEIEDGAAGRLLAAIIEQAVDDLKSLQRAGIILNGAFHRVAGIKNDRHRDALELIQFFKPDGMAEKTLRLLKVETDFSKVRRALNLEPQNS
jgi:hypothetical protein